MSLKKSKNYYPVALNLEGKPAIVIGGGEVAQRKVKSLLKSGAKVKVVSPELTPDLLSLFKQRKIRLVLRKVRPGDLKAAHIIIAAKADQAVNKSISLWARRNKILVNVVDQPQLSGFISPAVLRRNKAIVAVYTDGLAPVLSRDLKNFLKEHWDDFLSYRRRLHKSAA